MLGLAAPALAENTPANLTESEEQELRANMTSLGIDAPTQERLIQKMEAGRLPESLTEGATPVATISVDTPGQEGEIDVYTDGSRTKTTIQKASPTTGSSVSSGGSITKFTVKTFSGGSSHTGCLVKMSTIVYVAQFNANYTLVNGGNSYISSAYNWACAGFGCAIEDTGIKKRTADLNGPAKAEMRVRVSGAGVATRGYNQLFVKGAKAWTN